MRSLQKPFTLCYIELTTNNLQTIVDSYAKQHKMRPKPLVEMLKTEEYIKMAETLWPDRSRKVLL